MFSNSSQKDTIYSSLFINASGTTGIINGKYYETTWAKYGNHYYLQASVLRLGQFFAQEKCTSSIVWNGNKNVNCHDPENWACGGVPWVKSDVIIPSGRPNQPVIQVPVEIKSIIVQPNTAVTVQPNVLLKINGQ